MFHKILILLALLAMLAGSATAVDQNGDLRSPVIVQAPSTASYGR